MIFVANVTPPSSGVHKGRLTMPKILDKDGKSLVDQHSSLLFG
jgi:hypothetical protein